jgi:hypothetical protein
LFSIDNSESGRNREQVRSIARSSASRTRRAARSAGGLVTSRVPKVPKAVKLVRLRSGTDRIEVIADVAGVIVTAPATGYPPDGCDPLDFVGAGVGLGAGVGGDDGGASVGVGFGADEVEPDEELAGPLLLAGAADRELADAPGCAELRADADALLVGVPLDVAPALAP